MQDFRDKVVVVTGAAAAADSDTDQAFKDMAGPIVDAGIAPATVAGMMDNKLVSGFGG
jgi:hypothetical protein